MAVANTQRTVVYLGAGGPRSTASNLERALAALERAGRERWPDLRLDASAFARHVGERVATLTPTPDLADLRGDELFLACACARGDEIAAGHLESEYLSQISPGAIGIKPGDSLLDEAMQTVRIRLLVGAGDAASRTPKITQYAGLGPLGAWLRVVAMRVVLNLRARKGSAAVELDLLDGIPSSSDDPQLSYVRNTYGEAFGRAFRDALTQLDHRDRTLLKLYYLDGLPVHRMGTLFDAHGSTVSRWIARARDRVMDEARRRLLATLNLSTEEIDDVLRLIVSRIDVSIQRVLAVGGDD